MQVEFGRAAYLVMAAIAFAGLSLAGAAALILLRGRNHTLRP
jgi:hypothetical protein